MIAASEPLEFVPHGRTVLAKHPGQIYGKGHSHSLSENSLLYKLTNFAIKDESLLESKEDEQEWWCIREVFYRTCEDTEEDQQSYQKEAKYENMSESFRPPSRLKNDFNVSIKSELLSGVKKMETDCGNSAGTSRGGSANSSSNMSKKFNLNSVNSSPKRKPLDPKTDSSYEEELYVKGCTAVWSKGLISTPGTKLSNAEQRETICCYTIDNPIKHATFCNFYVDIINTMLIDALNSQIGDVKKNIKIEDTTEHLETEVMPSILLIDNKCMRVYAVDGREYITSIPFQVKKVWTMKYGVLLEKEAAILTHNSLIPTSFLKFNESNNSTFSRNKSMPFNMSAKLRAESMSLYDHDVPLPTCFSVSHPLDEVTPILMKSPSHGLQYYNDGDLQIIFVSTNPSIILLYDWKLGTHSLWRLRKALREECLSMCPNINSTTTVFSQSCDFVGSPMQSMNRNTTSWATGIGSPMHSKRPGTPTMSRSRQGSPMANIFHQQGLSPHASIGHASSMSLMANNPNPPSLPLYPDICLDHIWTDNQVLRRDPIENSIDTKTFLHTDLVGHDYLCFIVKSGGVSKLQIMRLQKSHSHGQTSKTNIIVGSVSTVLAKDAAVLEHLKMIALIDETGNIMLQSGNSVVGKVHVGGVLARLIDSPYVKRSTFQSPFPRRSSLLPSRSNETSTFDDSALHLLSPVPHTSASRVEQKGSLGLQSVADAGGFRVTLVFDTGVMYRISLPTVHNCELLNRCVRALTNILPKDITMQVIIKWYGVRNAPGTQDLTPEQEWNMFSNLLLTLIGYDTEKLSQTKQEDATDNTEIATKKQRTSSDGTQDDWDYLLNSKLHKVIGNSLTNILNLHPIPSSDNRKFNSKKIDEKPSQFNSNGLLFPYTLQILYSFHLVYEEIKLNTLLASDLKPLSMFLYQIAKDLKLDNYVNHYWLDFPTELSLEYDESDSQISEIVLKKLSSPTYFSNEPPNIFSYINSMLKEVDVGYYPYLTEVNDMSRDFIEILSIVGNGACAGTQLISRRDTMACSTPRRREPSHHMSAHEQAVITCCERGITTRTLARLPPALALLLLAPLRACAGAPPAGWPAAAYALLQRGDLANLNRVHSAMGNQDAQTLEILHDESAFSMKKSREQRPKSEDEIPTGMQHLDTQLLSLLYPKDHRMTEVFNMLQSSIPVNINLTQRPEVSDHDFIEEQEKYLYAIGTRTMALPIARGMLTLRTSPCTPLTALAAPPLTAGGRTARGHAVSAGGAWTWPAFHNGAAAALAVTPVAGQALAAQLYNKHRGSVELCVEQAGFLLALGLNGHLRDMPFMHMYEYLVKCHEMTSVGLLLGIAATYRGTMDVQATKMLSIHLEPLLPPTSVELDVQQNIVVAALMGIGLLYLGTRHGHVARVLQNQLSNPTASCCESCMEKYSYSLSAGLALGAVCVRSNDPRLAIDLRIRTLAMRGTSENYSTTSTPQVNLDVTSPGASLALGLTYLKSGDTRILEWLKPPQTAYLLDYVRPDLLMLRLVAAGLVMWDSIEASEEWIDSQVPETIKPYCFVKPTEDNIDYEAMNQAYCNIISGAALAMGLRFAGSGCEDARDAVLQHARRFMALCGASVGELAGRSTLEACMCVCTLAAGMIMSGRGDLEVLRVCRRLRARVPPAAAPSPLTHAAQMCVHMAVGLLFLGGGRMTLCTTDVALVAMLAAFFPKFPTHSEDNRYHLQAFRHLYVLAVEPRLILPRDIDTGKLCYAHIQVIDLQGVSTSMVAPCVLPELRSLKEVRIKDERYWPITFQRDRNWELLESFLQHTWGLDIKQRAGCLSYIDDPHGYLTYKAQTLTLDNSNIWSVTPENIYLFTNDEKIRNFVKHYLKMPREMSICPDCLMMKKRKKEFLGRECLCRKYSEKEMEFMQGLGMISYECVVKDNLCALPVWISFLKIIKSMKTDPTTYNIWQIKLLLSQIESHNRRTINEMKIDNQETNEPLISNEFTLAIKNKVCTIFDSWELKITPYLRRYLGLPSSRKMNSCDEDLKRIFSCYLTFYDLPRGVLKSIDSDSTLAVLLEQDRGQLTAEAVSKLEALLR